MRKVISYNKHQRIPKRQSKNGQSRETDKQTKKNKTKTLHIPEKLVTQDRQDGGKQTQNNPEKLATQDRKDGEKQNKNTTQSRETGNIGQKRRRETKQKHNTIQRNQ